ncbi:MAG: tRNA (N(6)-L-threonylcarbamoyladenosine(37)-C(2))-methylthiotransferase MtaB [Candidatus Omnitrophota bacterium]
MTKEKTIFFYTLGCRLNQAETAILQNIAVKEGFMISEAGDAAEVVVVNTCTVTEKSDVDTRRLVSKIIRGNPRARIALIGCQAQTQKEKLLQLPQVRWVVGNARKFDLFDIIAQTDTEKSPVVITPDIPGDDFQIPLAGIPRSKTRANLKIQDGCDFFCSYCEVPYARGRARSRYFADILREAKILVQAGHKELILTGVNIGLYNDNGQRIAEVVTALESIPGLERIRISSIEPGTIPWALIEKMPSPNKLCRYLHIPLQSGSNEILKSMGRKYSADEFIGFIREVHQKVKDICIGTDIIVGFPGETETHFQETLAVLRKSPINYFHVFSYSKRHLAKSRHFHGEVAGDIIRRRSQILRDLSQVKRREYWKSLIGTCPRVLFEEKKGGGWRGLTDHYIRVQAESNKDLRNHLVRVELQGIDGQMMTGKII